jgi:RecB family endonuclease NucS
MQEFGAPEQDVFAHECRIRDVYASRLSEFRPREKLLKTEYTFAGSRIRADMRSVDSINTLRIWEFKLFAGYEGLGQILTYLALERRATNFQREVRGVLAAFSIQPEIRTAVDVLNLGIELVDIPAKLRLAGGIPATEPLAPLPDIPHFAEPTLPHRKDTR